MKKFSINDKTRGELMVRNFNEVARRNYSGFDPICVYDTDDGVFIDCLGLSGPMTAAEAEDYLSNLIRYKVTADHIDLFYGPASTEYVECCQKHGLPVSDILDALGEWGPGIWDELEEI